MPQGKASRIFLVYMITLHTMMSGIPGAATLPFTRHATEDISGSEILSVFLGSESNNERIIYDINKKEAPRINSDEFVHLNDEIVLNSSLEHLIPITRNSRSNKNEYSELSGGSIINKNEKVDNNDDLEVASSSYYKENDDIKSELSTNSFGELINSQDESPKIIGVRVTSSVAVGRGSNNPSANPNPRLPIISSAAETARKVKSGASVNTFSDDSPTTWRPPHYPRANQDYHRGVPSNRHSVSTLPAAIVGANPDYIQQQKDRELNRKKQENLHPYQRSFQYHNQPKEGQRPRAFSYTSVMNTYSDSKHTTANDWSSSTPAESVATEASAGFVTIINHGDDNAVELVKDINDVQVNVNDSLDNVENEMISENFNQQNTMPSLPRVYSEPSKVYSEPSKVYSEPSKVYGVQEKIYSEPSKFYSEPAKVYSEPSKVYGEPSKVYGEPSKVYGEPSKVYGQPATVYPPSIISEQNDQALDKIGEIKPSAEPELEMTVEDENHDDPNRLVNPPGQLANKKNGSQPMGKSQGRGRGPTEQNYEVDESESVVTNGRIHGVQEKPQDDGQKVGYVVEGRNFRKYRVEERTADGFIVGEYGVVSHDDGSLRGVRYTADGTTNPRLIYDALMKFLSL